MNSTPKGTNCAHSQVASPTIGGIFQFLWATKSGPPSSETQGSLHSVYSPIASSSQEANMTFIKGFWSYVHLDDQAEHERITRLAKDVKEQFQMLTGEEISLFLDKDSIEWGENWREAIDSNQASVAFFIPVLTPRYFMRPECRRELETFARQATNLGVKELVLPLLYINVPELQNENTTDELMQLVRTFQWENWQELRFLEVTSEGYRRGVDRLATRLVEANRQAEAATVAVAVQADMESAEDVDEPPGVIDMLASAEETLHKLPETTGQITQEIVLIGQIMQENTESIRRANAQGQGFSARLILARQMANRLKEPVEHIWTLSNRYASQLHEIDTGVRMLIERARTEVGENPDAKVNFCDFFESILGMVSATREAMEKAQVMIQSAEPLEKLSRDIRPVMRQLRQGLTIQVAANEVCQEWANLIEDSGIECGEDIDTQAQ
jgi:hypothetical protein